MKTIYKYPLKITDSQIIRIHELCESDVIVAFKAQFMKAEVQNKVPCLWVMVDTDRPVREVEIIIKGTGEPCDDVSMGHYLATFQTHDGRFIWHAFWK